MRIDKSRDPAGPTRQSHAWRRILMAVAYLLSMVALFAIGCFLLGPTLSRMQHTRMTAVQSLPHSAPPPVSEPPSVSSNAHRESDPKSDSVGSPETAAEPSRASRTETPPAHNTSESQPDSSSPPNLVEPSSKPAPETTDTLPVETDEPISENPADAPIHRVRAGIFAERANADSLASRLVSAGFAPAVYQVQHNNKLMFSVQLGAFRRKESADQLARSLRQAGFEAVVTTDN